MTSVDLIHLLEQLAELKGTLIYVYQFIMKGHHKGSR